MTLICPNLLSHVLFHASNPPLKCCSVRRFVLRLADLTHSFVFFLFFFIQGHLEDIQEILNTTEISLHQLTALVDCRSLHMVREEGREGGKECGVRGVRGGGGPSLGTRSD